VLGAEHEPEQVLGLALVGTGAGGDDVVDDLGEIVGVGPEVRVGRRVVVARHPRRPGHAPLQAADHGLDEGVRFGALERPEVVVESGESDGVEGHPGHVVGHVHRLSGTRAPVPALDEPAGHLQHHGVVGAQGAEREGGHQDVVRLGPVGLVVVRSEESVGGEGPHVLQGGSDVLGEPSLVGEVGHQVEITDEQRVPTVQPPYEHRSVTVHQIHDLLHRGAAGACRGDVDDGDVQGDVQESVGGGMARQLPFAVRKYCVPACSPRPCGPRHGTT